MTSLANGLPFDADRPPLRVDEGGAVRVGNSRISLDLVVEQYENGMTPEDMVRAYDTLVKYRFQTPGDHTALAEFVNTASGLMAEKVALMWRAAPPQMPGEPPTCDEATR